MLATLSRRMKRWLFRSDYQRMEQAAAIGDYDRAANIAWILGEQEMMQRYAALHRTKILLVQTAPSLNNPFSRYSLKHRLRDRRN